MLSRTSFRLLTIAVPPCDLRYDSRSAGPSSSRSQVQTPTADLPHRGHGASRLDSKPIENASVIFHLDGDKGNMELKTNEDGKSIIDVLPTGSTMRLQIIAKGFQTYGQDYKIDKSDMTFDIRMKRPGEQYSIYKPHEARCRRSEERQGRRFRSTKRSASRTTRQRTSLPIPAPTRQPSIQTAVVRLP